MGKGYSLRRLGGVAIIASASALAFASTAGAKTLRTGYEPGGWTAGTTHAGLCLESLTCPSATNSTVAAKPSDFQHTTLGSLLGVGATTTVSWTSGAFNYNGAEGKASKDVKFVMRRRSNTSDLLSVAGNSATYSVNLISAKTGNTVAEAVRNANLAPTAKFTRVGPKRLIGAVRRGHSYQLQVTLKFTNGAEVIPGAVSDFKRARIVARRHVHH